MFVVYSNKQKLPILREIECDSNLRGFQENIYIDNIKGNEDYYSKIFEEIDEEYIKEHTSE